MATPQERCCSPFDPEPWDEKEVVWEDKQFVKTRVRSVLHIPLNFGSVMKKTVAMIEAADAKPERMVILSDENSLWGADVYLDVAKDVPNAQMAKISGTFLSKVFEGPYKNIRSWIKEMAEYVRTQGKETKKLYFYYTTCPRCAKAFGKNYVVLMAQV
jgi:hypothetical protein